MTQHRFNLIASFAHGNALGVVLEPRSVSDLANDERQRQWKVCIGPLVEEVAWGSEYPKDDYRKVVEDLKRFCREAGICGAWGLERNCEK